VRGWCDAGGQVVQLCNIRQRLNNANSEAESGRLSMLARDPTIKKSWVSHALFWTSAPVFEAGACRDLALALSLFLRRFYGRPHLLLFSSTGGRDATTVSFFLCLAAGSRLTQTQTWRPQMTCGLAFLSAIVMSFFSPTNNLRRSTRIHDASYRPRTTWRLPEIVSVASALFFSFSLQS
jgi:hypothetical protein